MEYLRGSSICSEKFHLNHASHLLFNQLNRKCWLHGKHLGYALAVCPACDLSATLSYLSSEISLRIRKNHQNQNQFWKGKRAENGNQRHRQRKNPKLLHHQLYLQNLFVRNPNQRSLKTRLIWLDRLYWLSRLPDRLNLKHPRNHAQTPNLRRW